MQSDLLSLRDNNNINGYYTFIAELILKITYLAK